MQHMISNQQPQALALDNHLTKTPNHQTEISSYEAEDVQFNSLHEGHLQYLQYTYRTYEAIRRYRLQQLAQNTQSKQYHAPLEGQLNNRAAGLENGGEGKDQGDKGGVGVGVGSQKVLEVGVGVGVGERSQKVLEWVMNMEEPWYFLDSESEQGGDVVTVYDDFSDVDIQEISEVPEERKQGCDNLKKNNNSNNKILNRKEWLPMIWVLKCFGQKR
eukprot:TRINITY_DN2421_c0_g1_i4.p1 TRINITY_DN2421_c0_g1~~TRINITY_DN2421_c0_g1_i4.p1  ORF type:complete len:216 (-),score=37.53 TRINITY_DN2421_c0_g1_i4:1663-2310(-)